MVAKMITNIVMFDKKWFFLGAKLPKLGKQIIILDLVVGNYGHSKLFSHLEIHTHTHTPVNTPSADSPGPPVR